MLDFPSCSHADALALAETLDRYARRFCPKQEDQMRLIRRTIASLAYDPDALLQDPIEPAILSKMRQIVLRGLAPGDIVEGIIIGMERRQAQKQKKPGMQVRAFP